MYYCTNCKRHFLYSSDHAITCPCHPANWFTTERMN